MPYEGAEVVSPAELQRLGLAPQPTGPLAASTQAPGQQPFWQKPTGSGIFSSPRGFLGPGALANADAWLYGRSPKQSEAHINQTLRMAGPLAASLAMPPVGYLASIPIQGGLQAGFTGATGGTTGETLTAGLWGAGLQALIGGIFKAAELSINKKAAQKIIAEESARARNALAGYEQKKAFDKAMSETLDAMGKADWRAGIQAARREWEQKTAAQTKDYISKVAAQEAQHAAAVQAHGDQSAARIMDAWKAKVPAWSELSSDLRGLVDAVVGKGQDLASAAFDTAMKNIVKEGAGKSIQLPRQVAESIGLEVPRPVPLSPNIQALLARAGRLPTPDSEVVVDAGKAAAAVLGKWRNFPMEYRATVLALDKAGLGSSEARAAYTAAQGLREVVDKTGAIGTRGSLDVDRLLDGLQKIKISDILRKRGLGNALEGDLISATRGGPLNPTPIPKPDKILKPVEPSAPLPRFVPTEPTPPGPLSPQELGIEYASNASKAGLGGIAGHALGYGVGLGLGHPYMGLSIGGGAGAALGRLLPEMVTKTPMTGGISDALRSAAMATGAAAAPSLLGPLSITPNPDEAAARAAEAEQDIEWNQRMNR